MGIDVADVGNVVALLLHPESQRKFPEQKLARTLRERRVEDLAILSVRPVPTDAHARPDVPSTLARGAVVVERKELRPPIVSRPGGVAALKEKVAGPVIAH